MGYEVFKNVSQTGAHDIVLRHPKSGKLTAVDVTFGRLSASGNLQSTATSKLRSGKKDTVIVVTEDRSLLQAYFDTSKGVLFEGPNGYPVLYRVVAIDTFN